MNQLFAGELEPWHRARESGMTLEEHILSITMHTLPPTSPSLDEQPTHRRPSRAKLDAPGLHWAVRIAIVLALFGGAYFATRWWLAPLPITAASPSP